MSNVQDKHDELMQGIGKPTYDELLKTLETIANGAVMQGTFTHAETVLAYQELARKAIADRRVK